MGCARLLASALAITLVQVVGVLALAAMSGAGTPGGAFESLCRWDGALYLHIAEHGYRTTVPPTPGDLDRSNVAFFPGYPLVARWIGDLSGGALSMRAALVVTAQLAAWGFWSYWLLFVARWRVARPWALLATLAVALHPAAFFLVVAYSESLFLFGLLGFLYWVTLDLKKHWPLAAVHGAVMTATRLGGLPVALC
ncbi:MAG: mannosyltransferase family protein, partial [Pirellulales bacterium]